MKLLSCVAVALVAVPALAQVNATDAQLIGKWTGKYKVDFSKVPADKRPPNVDQIKKQLESVVFSIELKKDKTAMIVNKSATRSNKMEGKWTLANPEIMIQAVKRDGQAVPPERQSKAKFKITKLTKTDLILEMLGTPVVTTLTLKRG